MATAAKARSVRRSRWAISFADLCLLLLAFFVLLQANSGRQREIVGQIAQQFGAPADQSEQLVAARLFEAGEAMLTPQGAKRLALIAKAHARSHDRIEIHSIGQDGTTARYDSWDLAAARLGAVARTLSENGISRNRLTIRGLDQGQKSAGGQTFTVLYLPTK
ncbi:MAG: OmpA family protein [Sphingobium sp.]